MSIDELLALFQYPFVQNMFLAGILASLACGIIGTYIVVKRLVFISGGIAHTSFGGIGLGYYLSFQPMLVAALFSVGAAITVGVASLKTKIREDSTIGILWVIGMALGIIFLKKASGYTPDPVSVLFGNILLVKTSDLWLMLGLVIVVMALVVLFYKEFLALTFDEEYARISGVPTRPLYILLLCLIAITVVLLIKVVGVVLVIALLTMPAAMASLFTKNMKRMMVLAIGFALIFTSVGMLLSLLYDLPPGPSIVLLAGVIFLAGLLGDGLRNRFADVDGEDT